MQVVPKIEPSAHVPAQLRKTMFLVLVDDAGVNVSLATDGRRIPQLLGHLTNGGEHVTSGASSGGALSSGQRHRAKDGARPGSKILGRKGAARGCVEVVVHVARRMVNSSTRIDVMKQLLPRELPQPPNDLRQPRVCEGDLTVNPALADEAKAQLGTMNLEMARLQRGEPVVLVLARVLVVSNADEGGFEQGHHRCQDLFSG